MKRTALLAAVVLLLFAITVGLVTAPDAARKAEQAAETGGPLQPTTKEVDQTGYVKGFYISHPALGSDQFLDHMKTLLETTELNAVVMDFKADQGWLTFPTEVALAKEIGADQATMVEDPAAFMQWFKDRDVYTIARIDAFKDNVLAETHPEWAILDAATGGVWRDKEKLGWMDPSQTEVWDYLTALAVEAAGMGFDEIQFDYVRFPTDGSISNTIYDVENIEENRIAALTGLFSQVKAALAPTGAKLGADVFGYTVWTPDDLGIGQQIEAIVPHLDVLSPMLYPSTFSWGLPGQSDEYDNAIAYPYEIVNQSTARAVERALAANPQIEVRPWIQDFGDYAFDWRDYTPGEIRRQMDGAFDAGARGWLLWDPAVIYTPEALVSATPTYPPNTGGKVFILAYPAIGETAGGGAQRTPADLRRDLEKLLAEGYFPVNLRDLVEGRLNGVPAGKRPIVLTFDGSTPDQFRLLPDGTVDPESVVGVLKAFHDAHPMDWRLRATFFIAPGLSSEPGEAVFGQPETALQKLRLLTDWGMEVGATLPAEVNLAKLEPDEAQRELARVQAQYQAWLPGYQVVSLLLPKGSRLPSTSDKAILAQGQSGDQVYVYKLVVGPAKGAAPSPRAPEFDPFYLSRIPATEPELSRNLENANRQGYYYISAGE